MPLGHILRSTLIMKDNWDNGPRNTSITTSGQFKYTMAHEVIDSIVRVINPAMADILDMRENLAKQVEDIRQEKDLSHLESGHRTVFHDLLQSKLPNSEKSQSRLRDEAFSLVTAGSGTSALAMKNISYFIAANPHVQQKLLQELKTVMALPDSPTSLQDIETLPYLNAVIREGLRLGHAVSHRLSRIFPEKTLEYGKYTIPPGTNVNMTTMLIHENEDIFPDPQVYRPERWLNDISLQRYLLPFGKGPRSCLGINLAWAELYLITAMIFRRFNFDVSGVDRERDVNVDKDIVMGVPRWDSPGIIVKVLENDS
ncbi:putative Trichodiene oxygenase [Glarea lozoyensis 74030]|uniref:Putative Trichodiene oxygenase n=1 Tax=Glarea lozoyensis (strain ATCC 74030 / MF5533) TaxID=1104152 RepID=H0ELC2_GLAL7|nr:putative Trichodiene oxygenase [Glarea lozoyensis 74030]